MKKKTTGEMIATLRKEHNMTQLQLAEKMGVTDKAVSKWERDLSCPDIGSIPRLAEIFGISVDELMQVREQNREESPVEIEAVECEEAVNKPVAAKIEGPGRG